MIVWINGTHGVGKTTAAALVQRLGPAPLAFRLRHLDAYEEALSTWLRGEAEVVDTTRLAPAEVAERVVLAVGTAHVAR